ncbi:MAG: glycoside hydrolase family 3 N-terminal domain-containing protein [Synechococcaceae cyanobacterium]|nr:glycoside hydrolase family 3 N-terminal domain-containing protein [Synechococcaceae cyanobacterium]
MSAELELRRAAAELLVLRCSGHLSDGQRRWPRWELDNASLQRLLGEGVGGVILLGGSAAELRLRTAQLQAWSDAPLLLCADVEEGVGQRFEGASWLLPPLAVGRLHDSDPAGAIALAERYGRCTGREARTLGLNWVLGPVCDVNNNPGNPVINVRAWGERPEVVAALAAAFCRGAQAEATLCCAKHFPGHGDTATDSHIALPLLPHDRARLERIELPPFRQLIAAGVASVMTAHLLLPALDAERPATLSAAVLTDLLRRDLGFGGLVVTDALVMEAISDRWGPGEAAVLALEAGADLVLMPADADAALGAIVDAVRSGRLSRGQLEQSRERRRQALARVDSARACSGSAGEGCEPPSPARPLAALSNGPLAEDQELALTLVRRCLVHQGGVWTADGAGGGAGAGASGGAGAGAAGVNLIRIDAAPGCAFLPAAAPALSLPAAAGLRTCLLEGSSPSPWNNDPEAPLALERLTAGPLLLQLFVRGNPFRGSASSREPWAAVIRQLLRQGRLGGLAVYGSPYLWEALQPLLPPSLPAAYSPGQMPLAQLELLTALGFGRPARAAARADQTAATPAADKAGGDGFTD